MQNEEDLKDDINNNTDAEAEDVAVEAESSIVESVEETPAETLEDSLEGEPVKKVEFEKLEAGSEPLSTTTTDYDAEESVTVQPVKFASFEDTEHLQGEVNKNLDILMDVKLQMTVELGRTELPIKKVLELTRGSIVELEKVAGEPVELYANGKLVAHGEVVVIQDNFGLRITNITSPDERLKGV